MHFLSTTLKVVYVSSTPMPELLEDDDTLETVRRRSKWENDDYICRGRILMTMLLVRSSFHFRIKESLRVQESDKGKGKKVVRPSINMMEEGGKNKNNKQNKGKKRDFKDNGGLGSKKKPKLACWKCNKTGHFKKDCRSGNKKDNASASDSRKGSKDHSQDQGHKLVHAWNIFIKYYVSLISEAFYVQVDAIAWWNDSRAITHVCKDRCWSKTYEQVEDGPVLYMGDDHFAPIHGKGSVVLEFSFGKSITLFNVLYTQLFSDLMKSSFEMSMMGEMTFFLGVQVNQSPYGIFINQSNYMLEILKKYGMESCARYQDKPTEKHLNVVKRIFCYLQGTVNTGLWYTNDFGFKLTRFSDADYAGCKDTFKSTFGGAQLLGEKLISWSSKKQDCTSLSTAEAKYVSLSACCAQVLWMRTQLTDYGFHFNKISIYCDSKSAIAISYNPVQHSRTKHIVVRYHFIKEHVKKGTIELYFVKMDYQLADLFTKALPVDRFNYLVRRLGMRSISPQELDRLAKSQ
ncbi:retrovirus-related pol polyprotein from transposon TNT 1-94 [Tanacetum coccineum]